MPYGDYVAMLQGMFFDELAVDVSAIGGIQVLKERVVQDIDDESMVPADGGIIDAHIVIRETTNGVALLAHVVLGQCLAFERENQSCHERTSIASAHPVTEAFNEALAGRETVHDADQHHGDIVAATLLVSELDELPPCYRKVMSERLQGNLHVLICHHVG